MHIYERIVRSILAAQHGFGVSGIHQTKVTELALALQRDLKDLFIPEEAEKAVRAEERERCARLASAVTTRPEHRFSIHPDIPFEQFGEPARVAAHSTAQAIAGLIRDLK